MNSQITWKRKFFSNTTELFSGETKIGFFREYTWKQLADFEISGKLFQFKSTGFFKRETAIIDAQGNKLGTIQFNSWHSKAIIHLNDKILTWKYDNFWNTRWSITDSTGTLINFNGSQSKGFIEPATIDPAIIGAGLFVTNYYWQTTAVIVIVALIPIITSV